MKRVLGNILYDLDPKVKVKSHILNFLLNESPPEPFDVATSTFGAKYIILGNILCDLVPKVKVKDQIMYFLVNVSPPKQLDVATSNFVAGKVT